MAPFPSVPKDQLFSILISAIVVEEFGMAPYWLSWRMFMTVGFTKSSTTNSSATLEIHAGSGISVWILFWCRPQVVYFWEGESRQPFSRWLEDAVQRRRHSGFPWWDRPPGRSILSAASWVFCPVRSPSLDWGHPVLFARAVRLPLRSQASRTREAPVQEELVVYTPRVLWGERHWWHWLALWKAVLRILRC